MLDDAYHHPAEGPAFDPGAFMTSTFSLSELFGSTAEEIVWDASPPHDDEGGYTVSDDGYILDDTFFEGKDPGPEILFGPGDDGPYELPPVDSVSDLSQEELDRILSSYFASIGSPPINGGGGSGAGNSTDSLGPDLSLYSCETLAHHEANARRDQANARSMAVSSFAFSDPFQGEGIYNDIWAAFEALHAQGLYRPEDPFGTLSRVFGQTVDIMDLLDLSAAGIARNTTVSVVQLLLVQSAFAYKLQIDRIDAEQARRGGQCGT